MRLLIALFKIRTARKHKKMNKYSAIQNPKSEFERGFTLIEIIVLIVMAGIIIPAIIVPFATGIRGSQKPEMVTKAMYFAHQRMEELMKYNYCNAALNVTGGFVAFTTSGEPNYKGQNNIAYVDDTLTASVSDVGYKMITVTVTDPQGNAYNVYSVVTRF
jgi:type II secretory pathway pseudopilin PulG